MATLHIVHTDVYVCYLFIYLVAGNMCLCHYFGQMTVYGKNFTLSKKKFGYTTAKHFE